MSRRIPRGAITWRSVLALAIAATLIFTPTAASASRKVRLCHRLTDSWSYRTVDARTAYRHLRNHSFYDVIEPFRYKGQTYSLNWNEEAETFLENRCQHPAPPNDLPDDAIPLTPGVTENGTTLGANLVGEAQALCLGEPPWHSVWYSFMGTGGSVEIEMASPDFWPVGAVYTRAEDGTFTEVDPDAFDPPCLFSEESPHTFTTEAGVTYWLQVGGFSEVIADSGRISIRVT
jgi:hypothetical protein